MRVPARRNLSKRPELYRQWPRCKMPGCRGMLYVDEYRLAGGKHDRAPACREPQCPYPELHMRRTGKLVPYHRVDNEGCRKYEDYKLERILAASRHRPYKTGAEDTCPF